MNATQNHSFSILFWINKQRVNDQNEFPIYARITVDGRRSEVSLQRFIAFDLWDQRAQKLKGRGELQTTLNGYIDLTRGNIQKIYNQILASGTTITAELIKEKLVGKEARPQFKTIIQAIEYHNLKLSEIIEIGKASPKTLVKYETTKKKVLDFLKYKFDKRDMPLPELRFSFITEFEHFLLVKQKIQNNTTHKYIRNLKKIMNMSISLEWITINPFTQFKCKYINPKKEILT
ncbi:MAG: phage integrase SAM-like domain and Arm DNA-binding domain-containing protein [Flavobacteriales bacterium]